MAERKSIEETKVALHDVVREMYDRIVKGEPPTMTLPVRTKNNIGFDSKLGVYKYGRNKPLPRCNKSWFCKAGSFVRCMLLNS